MAIMSFFSKRRNDDTQDCREEMLKFYFMLLKMKKQHSHLNIDKIMKKLYPDFKEKETS